MHKTFKALTALVLAFALALPAEGLSAIQAHAATGTIDIPGKPDIYSELVQIEDAPEAEGDLAAGDAASDGLAASGPDDTLGPMPEAAPVQISYDATIPPAVPTPQAHGVYSADTGELIEDATGYTITYYMNDGTSDVFGVKTARYGQDTPLPDEGEPTRDGYTFEGWTDMPEGGTLYANPERDWEQYGQSERPWDKQQDAALYAQWSGENVNARRLEQDAIKEFTFDPIIITKHPYDGRTYQVNVPTKITCNYSVSLTPRSGYKNNYWLDVQVKSITTNSGTYQLPEEWPDGVYLKPKLNLVLQTYVEYPAYEVIYDVGGVDVEGDSLFTYVLHRKSSTVMSEGGSWSDLNQAGFAARSTTTDAGAPSKR